MKSTKLLCLILLTVSIRQVSGEKETEKKCRQEQYKCGDVCVDWRYFCSCGNVTLGGYSSYYY